MAAQASSKRHWSLRLPGSTLDHLKRRADELGESQAVLAERYIDEGLRMDEHPGIVFRSGSAGRRPAVTGTRIDVWQVIETVKHSSNSIEDAAAYLSVPAWKVQACVRYYSAYKDEVDAWTTHAYETADREEEASRREQEVLA